MLIPRTNLEFIISPKEKKIASSSNRELSGDETKSSQLPEKSLIVAHFLVVLVSFARRHCHHHHDPISLSSVVVVVMCVCAMKCGRRKVHA